jgi:hypothetical protein
LNNLFFQIGNFTTLDASATGIIRVSASAQDATATALVNHLTTNQNAISNPGIQSISRIQDDNLDPRPAGNAAVTANLATYPNDAFFSPVNFKGAFSPFAGGLWVRGWTALDRNNHLRDLSAGGQVVFVNDASIKPCENVTWTKDKTYVVDGLTFVDSCATLTIEAGTVVKFTPRADVGNPSALIVARNGKIFANGTRTEPIIFTAEADDVNNPTDFGPNDVAQWGGLGILGNGITQKNGSGVVQLEGIPTSEARGQYGGNNNADNSGVLRYVSIRHGGRQIVSGSELNGLSLGAVGSGTTLEYVEIYANSDDGIEFFGGAPNLKYAVVAFAEDDSYDWDEVYTGKGQFWFSIQRSDLADAAGEFDGTTPDDATPYSSPSVFNWTHIGSGAGAAASNPIGWNLRAGTAGVIGNSIVTQVKGRALEVQDKAAGINDAYSKLLSGELKLLNNIFHNNNNGNGVLIDASANGIIRVSGSAEDATATALINHLVANQTSLGTPYLRSIDRGQVQLLDPRPCLVGTAYASPLASVPTDPFYSTTNFKGAFSESWNDLWIRDWTALARNNNLVSTPIENCLSVSTNDLNGNLQDVFRIFPNPTSKFFTVESKFDATVNVEIFDMAGRLVAQRLSLASGTQQVTINELSSGMYLIKFTTEDGRSATKKLIVE